MSPATLLPSRPRGLRDALFAAFGLAAACACAAGCETRLRFVVVTVDREAVTGDIYALRVTTSRTSGTAPVVNLVPAEPAAAPLDLSRPAFAIELAAGASGALNLTVEALAQDGAIVLGAGGGGIETETFPDRTVDFTVTLLPADQDGDGVAGGTDNCPLDANPGQEDCDADGIGDTCDADCGCCLDTDGDSVPDLADVCPLVADPLQEDGDADGAGDACDNCPLDANAGQEDAYPPGGDGAGDACDDTDLDGTADANDCAPEDAAVFLGAPDPCDGADTDCNPGFCTIDLGSQIVVDLAVSTDARVGFATDAAGGAGFFHTFDGTMPAGAALTNTTVAEPLAVALNPAYQHQPATIDFFYVVDGSDATFRPYSSATGIPLVPAFPGAGAGPAIAVSPFGELLLLGLAASNALGAIDPCETPGVSSDCYEDSGSTATVSPVGMDLSTTSTAWPNPGLGLDPSWRVAGIALRPDTFIDGTLLAYVIFGGQPALAAVRLSAASLGADPLSSGTVAMPPAAPATSVAYDPAGDLVLLTAGDGVVDGEILVYAAATSAAATVRTSTTSVPGGAVPSCPSAAVAGSDGMTVWMSDPCNDVLWRGTMTGGGAAVTLDVAFPSCTDPGRLGIVQAPGGDLVYAGCNGALGVEGSD